MANVQLLSPRTESPSPSSAPSSFGLEALEGRQMLSTSPNGTDPWAPYASIISQDQAVQNFPYLNGSTIRIAVIDRGIDYRSDELGGYIGKHAKVIAGVNFRDSSGITLDDYGHGTGVAGVIAANPYVAYGTYNQGVAPDVQIISLKQESSAGCKAALDWVIANAKAYNIQVVNLTDFITEVQPGSVAPQDYLTELQTLHDMGIVVDTPVGNGEAQYGPGVPIDYPAKYPTVNGIGGEDMSGNLYSDSRRGSGLTLVAPASNVTMPYYIRNKNSVGYDQYDDNYDGTRTIVNYANGTSWASAYVSGTAVLLKQLDPTLTPDQIRTILVNSGNTAQDPEQIGGVTSYQSLNVEKAIELGYQTADDAWHTNYSTRRAVGITFRKGAAALNNLKLLIGKPDYWAFNVPATGTYTITTPYSGPSAFPTVSLLNSRGRFVASIGKAGLGIKLTPGVYYVSLTSPQTLIGTYNIRFASGETVTSTRRASVQPAVVTSNVVTTSASTTAANDDVVLGKKQTAVFAG